jgi:hypothetical protein
MNKTCISISIDLTDEFESELLKYVESKGNKSRYIKRLIHADQLGRKEMTITTHEIVEEDNSEMKGFF